LRRNVLTLGFLDVFIHKGFSFFLWPWWSWPWPHYLQYQTWTAPYNATYVYQTFWVGKAIHELSSRNHPIRRTDGHTSSFIYTPYTSLVLYNTVMLSINVFFKINFESKCVNLKLLRRSNLKSVTLKVIYSVKYIMH